MSSCTDGQSEDRTGVVLEDTMFTTCTVVVLALGDSHCRLSCTRLFAILIFVLVMGIYQGALPSLAWGT